MFLNLLHHQYFWLSFLPIAGMGTLVWLLWFDRADDTKEPLIQLGLALGAGAIAALGLVFITQNWLESFWLKIILEELAKILASIVVMEAFQRRFRSISQGIMYGFAVGLGFALLENLIYLSQSYDLNNFSADFWLAWQGRFWTSTVLHGITTAFFGLAYAGAYLHVTKHKDQRESPLRAFFIPVSLRQFLDILTLHVLRRHLIWRQTLSLRGHHARAVILEGLWLALIFHGLFNQALVYEQPWICLLLIFGALRLLLQQKT